MSDETEAFVAAHRRYFWYKHYGEWIRSSIEVGTDGPFFKRKRTPWPTYAQAEALCKMMPCCYRLTDDSAYHPNKARDIDDDDT